MFNGCIHFRNTPHGWVISYVSSGDSWYWYRKPKLYQHLGKLIVCGNFKYRPHVGFAEKPHRLLILGSK